MSESTVRVWLAERTYSDDEQNLIILEYATLDGEQYVRKERALTSFDDERPTKAAIDVEPGKLGDVTDPAEVERYASAAHETAENYDPGDTI